MKPLRYKQIKRLSTLILIFLLSEIQCYGQSAQEKIKFVMDGREIHDMLNLLKIEGRWRIVNIIEYAAPGE